jgi:glutamine amidotransferase
MTDVAIIANGGANIASLRFALDRLGVSSQLTSAADAMERLHALGLAALIPSLTQPVLGICLGMQLLFAGSEEGDTECLGILPGRVSRFPERQGLPVPHMGWNQVVARTDSLLLHGLESASYVYFVHSYAAPVGPYTEAVADYGGEFSALVRHENFFGTQFHPERSSNAGQRILANFLALT